MVLTLFTYDADTGIVSNHSMVLSFQAISTVPRRDYIMSYTPNFAGLGTGNSGFFIQNDGLVFKSQRGQVLQNNTIVKCHSPN